MINSIDIFLETLPIVFAFTALPFLCIGLANSTTPQEYLQAYLSVLAVLLLIVAQSGWFSLYFSDGGIVRSVFDKIWTIFNCVVVVVLVIASKRTS